MAPVLKTQCPKCSGRLKITPQDEPLKVRCPSCQASIKIPALADLQSKVQQDDEMLDADEYLLSDEDDANDEYGDYDEAASGDDEYGADVGDDDSDDEYGDDEYEDDQDDEYEEMRRKRRRQQSARKKKKKAPEPAPTPQLNRTLLGGIGLALGVTFAGVMIWLFSGGDEQEVGPEGTPVAEGNGNPDGSGGAGGDGTAVPPEVVAEKARAFVRDQASVLDEPERSTWVKNPGGEISLNWDSLPPDAPQQRDIEKRVELSAKNAGIQMGINWCSLPRPERGQNSVMVNMNRWEGRQLQGERDPMSSAAELGYVMSGGMTEDGTLIGRLLKVRKSERHLYQHWVTIHQFDNSIVKVIPNARKMSFITKDRILLATDGLARYESDNPAQTYADSVRNHRLPREVWFRNLTTDEESERIKVRPGGHWLLSPTKHYLIVAQPDEASAESLKDPSGPHFHGLPSKTEVVVYKTATGEKVAEGVYGNMTVGYTGQFSSDGKKLALHAGSNVAVLDMTSGKVLAKGTGLKLEKENVRAPRWLAGDRILLLDWIKLIDVETGISFGGFARPQDRTQREHVAITDWLGGKYFRYSSRQTYQPFPVDELLASAEAITNPAANLMATGKVRLQVDGVPFGSLEQDILREALKEALRIRCNLEVTDEENDRLPVVQVAYSEKQAEGPFSMERWHQDATRQKVETDRNTWVKNVFVLEASLDFKCVTPDGRTLAEFKTKGLGVPGGMNFEIPGQLQFRNAAIIKAVEKLELDLPSLVPVDASQVMIPNRWKIDDVPADPPDYAALTIQKIDVNNSWTDQELGLPIRRFALLIKDLTTISERGFRRPNFVTDDGRPVVVMRDGRRNWFQIPIERGASAAPLPLPVMRTWAFSPQPGGEFAGFNEGVLMIGTIEDPAQAHQVKVDFVSRLRFSGDGSRLAMCLGQKGGFAVYHVADLKKVSDISEANPLAKFSEPDAQRDMIFSADGKILVTSDRGRIVGFDVDAGRGFFEHRVVSTPLKPRSVKSMAVSNDGTRLFAAIGPDIVEFSLKTLMEVRRIPDRFAIQLRLSPRGKRLAVARSNYALAVMNIDGDPEPELYKLGNMLQGAVNAEMDVAWSTDGMYLSGVGHNGLSVWKIEDE